MENFKLFINTDKKEVEGILRRLGYQVNNCIHNNPFYYCTDGLKVRTSKIFETYLNANVPIITLEDLQTWEEEDLELISKQFYYIELINNDKYILQLNLNTYNTLDSNFSYNLTCKVFTTEESFIKSSISKIRFATSEEIELLRLKVKENTSKVFNIHTKLFETPIKLPEFKPKDWVLCRDTLTCIWTLDIYSHSEEDEFVCLGGAVWQHCIPYEGNEHLLNTTNNPN